MEFKLNSQQQDKPIRKYIIASTTDTDAVASSSGKHDNNINSGNSEALIRVMRTCTYTYLYQISYHISHIKSRIHVHILLTRIF